MLGELSAWLNDAQGAWALADQALRIAPRGSVPWWRALLAETFGALHPGTRVSLDDLVELMMATDPPVAAEAVHTWCVSSLTAVSYLLFTGRVERAHALVRSFCTAAEPSAGRNPYVQGFVYLIQGWYELASGEDVWAGFERLNAARGMFQVFDHITVINQLQVYIGAASWLLGMYAQAEHDLRNVDDPHQVSYARTAFYLACVLAERGVLDQASDVATRLLESGVARHDALREGRGRAALAEVRLREGRLEDAEREARAACALLGPRPFEVAAALATLAATLLAEGRADEALAVAEEAMRHHGAMGSFGFKGPRVRLVHAEALDAAGQHEAARAALDAARAWLMASAERIGDAASKRAFLEDVPEHARTLARAVEWLGG
jgi:tetratricopeptide (TPR) repeat protein